MTTMSDSIDQLAGALAAIQAEVPSIPKDASNPFFKSKYADLASVLAVAQPIVTKHGIAVTQDPDFDGVHDLLTTTLLHVSGQWKTATMRLHLPKDDPQGQGSAITYAKRYAYMAALNLVADEDDDGNAASRPKRSQPSKTVAPPIETTPASPPGFVMTKDAKQRLLDAYKGDREAAARAWGDRIGPISETDLEELVGAARLEAAF